MRSLLLGPAAVLGSLSFGPAPATEDPLPAADPEVQRSALEHHVHFLAADELMGRALATPESRRVAEYLARALRRAGVAPGGAEGSFFQPVPLLVTEFDAPPRLRLVAPGGEVRELEHGREFSVDVQGDPLGTGRLAVLPVHAGEDLPAAADERLALVVDASRIKGLGLLEKLGFEGGRGFGLVLRARPEREGKSLPIPRRSVERAWLAAADGPEVVTVQGAAASELWEGRVAAVELELPARRAPWEERNVVGLVRGVGRPDAPGLADELVVLTAHFDHVGLASGGDLGGELDVIRNGADDDASGCAVLLELAEAFAAGPPPARSVVFLFCAAEEVGMWGTDYWVEHPTVPLAAVVANLNLEMLGMPDELAGGPGKLWLTGYERTDLGEALARLGIELVADPRPEERYFVRSDNIVFVGKGIVGQTLSTGGDNPNYHKVSDEPETLDFDHMEACARLAYRAARALADGTVTPRWRAGEPDLSRR